jgi:uncharacterized protein (UPF0218 family)
MPELGKLSSGTKENYEELRNKAKVLITVGDMVSYNALLSSITPELMIYNTQVSKDIVNSEVLEKLRHDGETVVDTRAGVDQDTFDILKDFFTAGTQRKLRLKVNGEENPLIVPCIALAPTGSLILKGERNVGIRVIEVNDENKEDARKVLKKYFGVKEEHINWIKEKLAEKEEESSIKAFLSMRGYAPEQVKEAIERAKAEPLPQKKKEEQKGKTYAINYLDYDSKGRFGFLRTVGKLAIIFIVLVMMAYFLLPSLMEALQPAEVSVSNTLSVVPDCSSSRVRLSFYNKGNEIVGQLTPRIVENNAVCGPLVDVPANTEQTIFCEGSFVKGQTYTIVVPERSNITFIC